ncbi:sigma-70 family RNA polymerase sigma factor [Oerskovia jenensis]|uniref:RNA polymerase sigma factor (Sigma-70 family) n=1 Tax=Oerskovia jenensis TaxID=162169 RepID=A0ABS2LKK5_9CELL|nr:sigma-70 family RNA polymerase sigma factor [Oerskovia jenensis]MBM7480969.1 RNA polymerase sigma factor (sigma-70 family) [Oerskovia jenensis]
MTSSTPELSDVELVARVRAGDREAYADLWQRHRGSALSVARQYAGIADPEDIVQEATRAVLAAILAGGGPYGAFRPYLNQSVRNTAISMSRRRAPQPVGDLHDVAERSLDDAVEDPADGSLEKLVTVRAFKALPSRWQSVLWFTCVEGLNVRDAGARLGLSPNATSALAVRAREGLRKEWLRAHLSDHRLAVTCRTVVEQLPALERGALPADDLRVVETHLRDCLHCSIVAAEINDLAARLPVILAPLVATGFDLFGPVALRRHAVLSQRRSLHRRGPVARRTALRSIRAMASGPGKAWAVGALVVGGAAAAAGVLTHGVTPPNAASTATEQPAPTGSVVGSPDLPHEAADDAPGFEAADDARPVPVQAVAPVRVHDDQVDVETDVPDPAPPATGSGVLPDPADLVASGSPEAEPPDPSGRADRDRSGEDPGPAPAISLPAPTVDLHPRGTAPLWALPVAGTGTAHATVELVDTTGTVVAKAAVGNDGRWQLALLASERTADLDTYSVRQVDQDGAVSPQELVGTYGFAAPSIDVWHVEPSGLERPGTPGVALWLHGSPGVVQTKVDGSLGETHAMPGGLLVRLPELAAGPHTASVRYVNPWTGETGAWRSVPVMIPAQDRSAD